MNYKFVIRFGHSSVSNSRRDEEIRAPITDIK